MNNAKISFRQHIKNIIENIIKGKGIKNISEVTDMDNDYEYGFIPEESDKDSQTEEKPEAEEIPETSDDTETSGDTAQEYEYVQSFTTEDEQARHIEKVKEKPERRHRITWKMIAAVLVFILLAGGCGVGGAALYDHLSGSGGGNSISRSDGYTLEDATGSKLTVAEIADKNADAVVEIRTESVVTDSWIGQYVTEGAGSGVIIDSDAGYIMTNYHVISGANSVKVKLHSGKEYEAEIVGGDSKNDVAVIQIKAEDLTAATYGNSDQLTVGEIAVAIGNPLGELGGTVTYGIISATDREVTIDGQEMTLLQTDASINPGNSGGGLFNGYGQLIGLVCAKSSGSDVEGLGFAIPVNTAAEIAQQIIDKGGDITTGKTGEAAIGVTVANINSDDLMQQYGLDKKGVYITSITSSNAQEAGLQIGDRFVKVDGQKVSDFDDLSGILSKHAPGDEISIAVERNGKKVTLKTVLTKSSESSSENSSGNGGYGTNPFE